jgi:TPR repeat protein
VKKDYKQALQWYTRASSEGNADALNNIGKIYEIGGFGISRNYDKAFIWYTKLANHGSAIGQASLGGLYHHGLGIEQDHKQALQ